MHVLREMNGKKSNIIKINKSKPLFFVWKLKLETENKSIVLPWTPQLLSLFEYYCIYCLIGVWFHSCCTTFPSSCFSSFWLLASLRWRERFVCTVDHKTSDWTYEFLHMKLHSGILAHEITLWNSCSCFLFYRSTYHPCLLKAIEPGSFL
jgi:hypothetical protein